MLHIPAHKFESAPAHGPASIIHPASWKVEVIADSSGKWCGNAARYASEEAAKVCGQDLCNRWLMVREWRVVPSDDKPNYDVINGQPVAI